MSNARVFNYRPIVGADRKTIRGVVLHCASCPERLSLGINSGKGHRDDEQDAKLVIKKFERAGWTVGANAKFDYCNACTAARKRNGMSAPLAKMAPAAAAPPAPAPAPPIAPAEPADGAAAEPRQMAIDDALLIAAKLNEVYDSSDKSYVEQWNDQKVADGLGVPRAWVTEVRRKQYGEGTGDNEAIRAALGEADTVLTLCRAAVRTASEFAHKAAAVTKEGAEINAALKILDVRASKIERTLVEIRESMR